MLVSLARFTVKKTNICVKKPREREKKLTAIFFLKNPNPVANSKQTKENPQINYK